jgi:hypothetical protein
MRREYRTAYIHRNAEKQLGKRVITGHLANLDEQAVDMSVLVAAETFIGVGVRFLLSNICFVYD